MKVSDRAEPTELVPERTENGTLELNGLGLPITAFLGLQIGLIVQNQFRSKVAFLAQVVLDEPENVLQNAVIL